MIFTYTKHIKLISIGENFMEEKEKWIRKSFFLGIVFFLAIFFVKPIDVTRQFSILSGMIYYVIDPTIIWEDPQQESGYRSSNAYLNENQGELAGQIKNPLNYDLIFFLSIPIGAMVAHLIPLGITDENDKRNKRQVMYEEEFIEITKVRWKKLRKFLKPFLAGVLFIYGFRLADGCIEGHIISGLMQGSISVYLFAGIVLAIAIPVAIVSGHERHI